jgi:uncharacterized damage-inducible protein DinB
MKDILGNEMIRQSVIVMHQDTNKIIRCLQELDEENIWISPNEHLNSIGNLILHLCGNIRQYIISSLGREEDIRERKLEFSTRGGYQKSELIEKLQETIEKAVAVMGDSIQEELLQERIVQGNMHSGIGIIVHVTEHYSYHTGQIIFLTKLFQNMDLNFYPGADLNKRNVI